MTIQKRRKYAQGDIKMSSYLPAGITQAMCDVGVWEHEFAINNVGEKCERCRLCGTLVSEVDTELPLEEGVCYTCMFGSTGDPEDYEER